MSPKLMEILDILSKADRPMTAGEIYDASNIIEKRQQVFSGCFSLRDSGLIHAIPGEEPKRYRITEKGLARLGRQGADQESGEAPTSPPAKPAPSCLAEALEQALNAPRLPDGFSIDDCHIAAETIERIAAALEKRFGSHDDIQAMRLGANIIRNLMEGDHV